MRKINIGEKQSYLSGLDAERLQALVVDRLFLRLGFSSVVFDSNVCASYYKDVDRVGYESVVTVLPVLGSLNLSPESEQSLASTCDRVRAATRAKVRIAREQPAAVPLKCYVIATGKVNAAAQDHMAKQLDEVRLVVLDRDGLIEQIDAKCPEVWAEITADVFPYLHSLSKLVDDQALIGPGTGSVAGLRSYYSASDQAFVDLKLVKSVAKSRMISGKLVEDFEFKEGGIGTLLRLKGERLLLLGDAGAGKSTLLVRAAYLMARESAQGRQNYRVPIVMRAGDLSGFGVDDLRQAMHASVHQVAGAVVQVFGEEDLVQGKVVLMVDGLDEVADIAKRHTIVSQLNEFYAIYPRCSIILTTRPYTSVDAIEGLKGFARCRISTMSLIKAERIFESYQRGVVDRKHANEVLRRIVGIHGIELNPLLVAVFALTSENDRRDIPANITELFSKFTEMMLGRWDETKGVSQQFQARVKEHVLSRFAYKLHMARGTTFQREDFEIFAIDLLATMNHQSSADVMIHEIFERSGLLRETSSGFEFRHHLIQEYFAGLGIPSIDLVKALVAQEWWRNPIVFHFGKSANDIHGLLDVATSIVGDAQEACLTIGLAVQTCYLAKLEEKIDVWKWVVENLSCLTDSVLAQKDKQKFPILHGVSHYLMSRDAVALAGIERPDVDAMSWATSGKNCSASLEMRKFWAYVGLLETGHLDVLEVYLKKDPIEDPYLNLSLYLGCRLVEVVRSVNELQKQKSIAVQRLLERKVAVIRYQFAKEYRGQLLEYRKGGIVALDQVDEDSDGYR